MPSARNVDPTRTTVLRTRGRQHYSAMWQRIERRAVAYLDTVDYSRPQARRVAEFNQFIDAVLREEFGTANSDPQRGVNAIIVASYLRGVRDANFDLGEDFNRYAIYEEDHDGAIAALILLLSSQLANAQANVHAQALDRYGRADDASSAKEEIRDRLRKVGRSVTNAIIASIVVRSFNEAILTQYERRGVFQVGLQDEHVFWQTAGDSRVCAQCRGAAARNNGYGQGVYTIAQARGLIPLHNWCRCRWRPVINGQLPVSVPSWRVMTSGVGYV